MNKHEKPDVKEMWKEILERESWVLDDLKKNIEILTRSPILYEEIREKIFERQRNRSN